MKSPIDDSKVDRRASVVGIIKTALREPIVLALLVLFAGAAVMIHGQHSRIQADHVAASALRDAARYSEVVREFRTLYTSEVVKPAKLAGLSVSHDYMGKEGTIPLPATLSMVLGNRIAGRKHGGATQLYSNFPFPWREESGGLADEFARDAWEALNENPTEPFWRVESVDGLPSLRYATADLMRSDCVQCHNTHDQSPKTDWKVGDVRGVLEVVAPLDQALAETEAARRDFALLIAGLFIPGLITVVLVVARLRHASHKLQSANGELHEENLQRLKTEEQMKTLNESLQRRADELQRSRIAALNMMRDSGMAERQQREVAEQLSQANDELEQVIAERERGELEREKMHHMLVEASREAGMAEVATGVLHNVGNVLNSVNVSATLLMDELRGSRVSSLVRVSDEIAKHHDDLADFVTVDERGKHLPRLMGQLSGSLQNERDSQVQELQSLIENVEHIKEIVNTQQSLATVGGAREMLQLVDLVHEAVKMNGPTIARHDVQVVYELDDVPAVSSERHKILQILVNLIGNAVGATKECEHEPPTIHLSVATDGDNVCARVRDNGTGIAPENLNRIFTHGFTTKADGHGFGLHSSALAAQDLKGSLSVHSDGPGCGAEFILQIPVREDSECKV